MVFPVVMYGCESWTVKKAEHRRIDAFELWCWRRLLRVPCTARRSNQSILKEISSGISLKEMMLNWNSSTLATSCEELTHWKRLWCWEGLQVGGEGDDRGWDGWMASLTGRMWVWVNSGSWWWTGRPGVLRFMRSQRVGHDWATDLIWSKQLTYTYKLLIKCMLLRPTVYIWMEDPLLHILQSLDGLIIKYVSSILQLTKPLCMICSVFYFSYILNQVFFNLSKSVFFIC